MEPLSKHLFLSADKDAWMAQVQKELKNESVYESLQWQTEDGFLVEPYYTAADLDSLPLETIQKAQKTYPDWLNTPGYQVTAEKTDNVVLRNALTQGAEALLLNLSASGLNIAQLLNGIKLSETPVFFRINDSAYTDPVTFIKGLQTVAPYSLKGGLFAEVSDKTAEVTQLTANSPQFRTVYISSHSFHNAGATASQELAYTVASLADAYDKLTDSGLTLEQLVPKTIFSLSIGTSYFLEIAKLRALRVLLFRVLAAYKPSFLSSSSFFIHCQTSAFYDATVTPYTNLLRATTEAMAAVIGGCDALTVQPYDAVVGIPDEFSTRIARNVSILLKQESHFDKVADPSAGSYYVESLTNQLIESAWPLFLDVEKRGGLAKAMTDGYIQSEIEQAYRAKVESVHNGKVLVGVTKFRPEETGVKTRPISPNTNLLPTHRLAEEFE